MTDDGANASPPARGTEESDDDYDAMLDALDLAIQEAREKIESGRVYDPENEKVRIKWIRAIAYAINVRRQVTVDRDLEELSEEVDRLKEQHGVNQ